MEEEKQTNTLKAKDVSLLAQILGAIWIASWSAYKFIKNEPNADDIIKSGMMIAACFSPVYLNLFIDKITKPFLGENK